MSGIGCPRAEELVSARLDRELSAGESAAIEEHLAGCADCRRAAGEYARLAAELESALRAGPLRVAAAAGRRRRPGRLWLRLAAAAVLAAAGALGIYKLVADRPGTGEGAPAYPEVIGLAGGTTVIRKGPARLELLGPGAEVNEVLRLDEGEIEVHAARAASGRRAVRVETPLGTVETLGTVFTVKLVPETEGGRQMRFGKMAPLAAALLLVGVSEGQVLVRGALGEAVVQAGETAEVGPGKLAVGKTGRIIKGKVTGVEKGAEGKTTATISVGKQDGVREGFEFKCEAKGWTGKVTAVAAATATVTVTGKAAVGDVVETGLTTVLAKAPPADPNAEPEPGAAPAVKPPPAVAGLQLTLAQKETVHAYKVLIKDGKRVRMGQGMKKPEGAKEEAREWRRKVLTATLKNVGEQPILLPFATHGSFYYIREIKLCATDAEGKAVPEREFRGRRRPGGGGGGGGGGEEKKDGPLCVTILKPGQSVDARLHGTYRLNFPAEGKYKLWAELEVKDSKEVLPGQKTWSGKLKSNEIDWEHKRRGARGWRRPALEKKPEKKPENREVF